MPGEAEPILMTDEQATALARIIKQMSNISGPVRVTESSIEILTPTISGAIASSPATPFSINILKITGFSTPSALGGGWYWALVQTRNSTTLNPASTFTSSTYYTNVGTTSDYVLLQNVLESGSATHDLGTNSYVPSWATGESVTVGGTSYAVYQTLFFILSC